MTETTKPPQTALGGVSWATAYHDYFAGNPAQNRQKGEASHEEMAAIVDPAGTASLPSASRLIFDVDNLPNPSEVMSWPTWTLTHTSESGVVSVDVLCNETPEGNFSRIQAPETPGSVWDDSLGYRLLVVYDGWPGKGTLDVACHIGTIKANDVFHFPRVAGA